MESGSLSQGGRATPSAAARVRAGAARPRVRAPGGGVQRTRDLGKRLGDQDVALYVVHDLVQHGRRAVNLFPHWRRDLHISDAPLPPWPSERTAARSAHLAPQTR